MLSRKTRKEVPKRCRCKPSCGKILVKRSRLRHYRKIRDKSHILPSETVSDRDSISDVDKHDFLASNDHVDMIEPISESSNAVSERSMSIDSSHSINSNIAGAQSISHRGTYADDHLDSEHSFDDMYEPQLEQDSTADGAEVPLDFGDVEYDEEEEMEDVLTLEEQQQQLDDAVGGELEQQLYDARE